MKILTNDELIAQAPAIGATSAHTGVSDRYNFTSTLSLVDSLRGAGWQPTEVTEMRVRREDRKGFQKHVIRFNHADHMRPVFGDTVPQAVLINSHDRSSASQLWLGAFRMICSNGMIVCSGDFGKVSVRHTGDHDENDIFLAFQKVLQNFKRVPQTVAQWSQIQLDGQQRMDFYKAALRLRYDDIDTAPIRPEKLGRSQRFADGGTDLWRTYNRVQENLIRGGVKDPVKRDQARRAGKHYGGFRKVSGVDTSIDLNSRLWELGERVAAGQPLTVENN